MTTNTPVDLPTLTSLETDAAIAVAWAEPGASMLHTAAKLKLAPSELTEILERPHVAAFAQAAREIELMREERLDRHDRAAARADLLAVAKDPEATIDARLRAAIAVLHDLRAGPTSSTGATPKPRQYLRPASADPRAPRLPAPAKPPDSPTFPNGKHSGTPTVPGGRQPDQQANNQPPPAPTSAPRPTLSNSSATTRTAKPITLHDAAGAPLTHRADHDRSIEHHRDPRAAPPTAADRPP